MRADRIRRRAQRRAEERGRVVSVFTGDPHPIYGLDLIRRSNVRAGRLYPILDELLADGAIETAWAAPTMTDRTPRRRYYQVKDRTMLLLPPA